jgi:hypothetical protein
MVSKLAAVLAGPSQISAADGLPLQDEESRSRSVATEAEEWEEKEEEAEVRNPDTRWCPRALSRTQWCPGLTCAWHTPQEEEEEEEEEDPYNGDLMAEFFDHDEEFTRVTLDSLQVSEHSEGHECVSAGRRWKWTSLLCGRSRINR